MLGDPAFYCNSFPFFPLGVGLYLYSINSLFPVSSCFPYCRATTTVQLGLLRLVLPVCEENIF